MVVQKNRISLEPGRRYLVTRNNRFNRPLRLTVEEINGSIVWATGDMSSYPYSSWSQLFSGDTESKTQLLHHAWVTSPVIDLRPNANGRATPVQFDLRNEPRRRIRIPIQSPGDANSFLQGMGRHDGTINTTFPTGTTDID